ncbi:hypothetical protein SAMN04487983_103649 [Streptomyces sp. yr375]|uniref:hypothetical protein n=1 Tax=Streptomyces sp. yr375 TaxID=1761906 RepID=UPI0008AAFDC3|nr:hypothetical protein [Streptomyces sp. yr375]SES21125.1 hypothetical protein SAMN04487983_103649 [Streptomyces sp. yr375]
MRERIAGFRESLLRTLARILWPARHRAAVQPEPPRQEPPPPPVDAPPKRVPHLLSMARLQELYAIDRLRELEEEEASR